jgi:hypothetical protein
LLLYDMGMTDCHTNLEALKRSKNDINVAISQIIT